MFGRAVAKLVIKNVLDYAGQGCFIGGLLSGFVALPWSTRNQKGYLAYFVNATLDLGCKYLYDPKTMTKEHQFDRECSDQSVMSQIWSLADERFEASPDYLGFNWLYFGGGLIASVAIGACIGFCQTIYENDVKKMMEQEIASEKAKERLAQLDPIKVVKKENRANHQPAAFFQLANAGVPKSKLPAPPAYEEDKEQDKEQDIRFQLAG